MDIISLLIRLAATAFFYFLPDWWIQGAVRSAFRTNPAKALKRFWYLNISLFILVASGFLLMQFMADTLARFNTYIFGVFVSVLITKLIIAVILLITEDSWRIPFSLFTRRKRKAASAPSSAPLFISRRTFISRAALITGILPFSGYIYGMVRGRYAFTVHRESLHFDDLPAAFDGLSIVQISDLHIGSWDHAAKAHVEEIVSIVNSFGADIVFFTGDIVNSKAEEMNGWYDTLKSIQAKTAKYSILGNHDYGDYVNWKTEEDKAVNLSLVKNIHPAIGFNLLLNEHTFLEKNNERLYIAGVENWGDGDFPKFGDLDKAYAGIPENAFTILLSHDPSHWRAKVLNHAHKPHLMLSGHTHGFQMGIETPAFRLSPSQLVYREWAGLYQEGKSHLYVNRGLGTVGYPGRLGIWPEITHITLHRKL